MSGKRSLTVAEFDRLYDVLREHNMSAEGASAWFGLSNDYLKGKTPLQAVRDGQLVEVVVAAHEVGKILTPSN